jgi:hypothetical protein
MEQRTHFEGNLPDYFQAPARDKRLAVASLVLGIVSCFTLGLAGLGTIAGIVTGVMALRRARSNPARYEGEGLAIAGIATSVLSIVIAAALAFGAMITIPRIIANARTTINEQTVLMNLKGIASAERTYHDYMRQGSYGTIDELRSANLINHGESAQGYKYRIDVQDGSYAAYANPEKYPDTGFHSYYVSKDGIIRFAEKKGQDASQTDPPAVAEYMRRVEKQKRKN